MHSREKRKRRRSKMGEEELNYLLLPVPEVYKCPQSTCEGCPYNESGRCIVAVRLKEKKGSRSKR